MKVKRLIIGWIVISTPFILALTYLRYDLQHIIFVGLGFGAFIILGVKILTHPTACRYRGVKC